MRLALAILTLAALVPAAAQACGQGYRTPPYQNLFPGTVTFVALDAAFFFYDVLPTPASHNAATAELAVAGTGAASSLMLALSGDARSDGSWPVYLAFGAISGLLATHAAWVLAHGERPAVELSAGTGVGHGTLGTRIALREGGFGAHLSAGMPLVTGYQGIGGGLSWVGEGAIAPLVALNAALQTLPDGAAPYYAMETRGMISFSLDAGVRVRAGNVFIDLAAGPVAQHVQATSYKPWNGDFSGWRAAAPGSDFHSAGAWPLPLDLTVAVGMAL